MARAMGLPAALLIFVQANPEVRKVEEAIRKHVGLDLLRPEGWLIRRNREMAWIDVAKAVEREIRTMAGSWGGSPDVWEFDKEGKDIRLAMSVTREEARRFSYRVRTDGTRLLTIERMAAGTLRLSLFDEPARSAVVFLRYPDGRTAIVADVRSRGFAQSWNSLGDAFRKNPVALRRFLIEPLTAFPVPLAPTPAHPSVIEIVLRWETPGGRDRESLDRILLRLADEDPVLRERATEELRKFMEADPYRMPLLQKAMRSTRDPEVLDRIQRVRHDLAERSRGAWMVIGSSLWRDLEYLDALAEGWESGIERRVLERIEALTGRTFESLTGFRAWYAGHKDRLQWDEKLERYTVVDRSRGKR